MGDGYAAARVHRFSSGGTPLGGWGEPGRGPGQFLIPHAVWVQPDGTVVVADRDNSRLQFFTPTGGFIRSIEDFHKPMDIWGDAKGQLGLSPMGRPAAHRWVAEHRDIGA